MIFISLYHSNKWYGKIHSVWGVAFIYQQWYVYPKLLSGLNSPGMPFRVKLHLPNPFWDKKYIYNKMYIHVDAPIRSICFCVPSASKGWYMILYFAISTEKCICPDEVSAHFLGTRMRMDILIWLSAQCDVLFDRIFIMRSCENRSLDINVFLETYVCLI